MSNPLNYILLISSILSILIFSGCDLNSAPDKEREKNTPTREGPPVIEFDGITEFTAYQRSTSELPYSGGSILIALDDITRGQVMVSISWKGGSTIVASRSLRQGDIIIFEVGDYSYKLKLDFLNNVLIGEDLAEFKFWKDTPENDALVIEQKKIELLIANFVLLDATFIRNEKEHTKFEAYEHIQNKYKSLKKNIYTADEFIKTVVTKSSVSQKPYIIRFSDGTEINSGEWFSKELATLALQ